MFFQLFCLLFTALLLTPTLQANTQKIESFEKSLRSDLREKIIQAQKTQDYMSLANFLKTTVHDRKKLKKIKKIAEKLQENKLLNALSFTTVIEHEKGKLEIFAGDLLQIGLFIETKLPQCIQENKHFLSKEITGLDHALEYDPETKQCFIVLDGVEGAFLGKGAQKTALKSILYHPTQPEIVVRLEQFLPYDRELALMRRLQGLPGLFITRAFTTHTQGDKIYRTVYANLYNCGSIGKMFYHEYNFSLKEKIKIAWGYLTGLSSLHKNGIAHRDIKLGNCLVNIEYEKHGKKKVTGVIADFGCCRETATLMGEIPNAGPTNSSPEGIFYTQLKRSDYYATDVFAMGCLLYKLYYGVPPPWKNVKYFSMNPEQFEEKHNLLVAKINGSTKEKRERLANKKAAKTSTLEEDFEYIILCMVHPEASKRGGAEELRGKFFSLYKLINK